MNPVAHVLGKCLAVSRSWLSTVYKPEGGSVISAINSQVLAKLGSERAEIREAVLEVSHEKSFGASDLAITHPFEIITEIFEVYWLGFFYMVILGNDWFK